MFDQIKIFVEINHFILFLLQKLKTNQGRFVLSSSGDLQIVQLHRTDAGTYVCVAYNGIGDSVEREVHLSVDGKFCYNLFYLFDFVWVFWLMIMIILISFALIVWFGDVTLTYQTRLKVVLIY